MSIYHRFSAATLAAACLGFVSLAAQAALAPATEARLQRAAEWGGEADMKAAVIAAIGAEPDQAGAIVARASELAPEHADAVAERAAQVFPGFAGKIAALGGAGASADAATDTPRDADGLPEPGRWSGKIALGGTRTSGNTEQTSVSADAKTAYEVGRWTHTLEGAYRFARDNDTTTARRLRLSGRTDYDITERWLAFGKARYTDDRFSGFDYEVLLAAGPGYRIFRGKDENSPLTWTVRAGPAYRHTKERSTGETEGKPAGIFESEFEWDVSDKTELSNDTSLTLDADRRRTDSTFAVTTQLIGAWDGRLSYEIRHNSEPPAGFDATDTEIKASLVYKFGED